MNHIKQAVNKLMPELIAFRRHMHRYPELSGVEYKTQQSIEAFLDEHDIAHFRMAGTGVIATVGHRKPVIGIRCDIDALPIQEMVNSSFKSEVCGVMHACGHDMHTAINLGVAAIVKQLEDNLNGTAVFIFEPAEETYGGAQVMLEEGLLEKTGISAVLGLHVMPYLPTGDVELKYDKINASTDEISIEVRGKSCHGAYPENGVDAILIAAQILNNLQSIVSRNTSPLNSIALSFGTISGGTKPNIVANQVTIKGTLRTLDQITQKDTITAIKRIVQHTASAFNGSAEVVIKSGYLPLINDERLTSICLATAQRTLGHAHTHIKKHPSMGAESFAFLSDKVPGMFYMLGCKRTGAPITGLHDDMFDPDEAAIAVGVELNIQMLLDIIASQSAKAACECESNAPKPR